MFVNALWMQCSCGVWINRSYGKSDLKINFGWFMRLSPVQYLWEKFVHGVCLKGSYFDVSWTGMSEAITGKESITVCFERNFRKLPCENIVLFGIKKSESLLSRHSRANLHNSMKTNGYHVTINKKHIGEIFDQKKANKKKRRQKSVKKKASVKKASVKKRW